MGCFHWHNVLLVEALQLRDELERAKLDFTSWLDQICLGVHCGHISVAAAIAGLELVYHSHCMVDSAQSQAILLATGAAASLNGAGS